MRFLLLLLLITSPASPLIIFLCSSMPLNSLFVCPFVKDTNFNTYSHPHTQRIQLTSQSFDLSIDSKLQIQKLRMVLTQSNSTNPQIFSGNRSRKYYLQRRKNILSEEDEGSSLLALLLFFFSIELRSLPIFFLRRNKTNDIHLTFISGFSGRVGSNFI